MPAASDDYGHAMKCANGFQSAVDSYFHWNGRLGELMLVSFAAALPPLVFDLVNSLIGASFLFLFFFLIFGHFPKERDDFFYFSFLMFCIVSLTMFGSIFVWISGSVNYLWGFFLIALWWMPIRLYLRDKKNKFSAWLILAYFILGIFAGWSSEQVGIISILLAFFLLLLMLLKDKFVPFWLIMGLGGFVLGFCLLYFCPGAQLRSDSYKDYLTVSDILMMGLLPFIHRCVLTIRFSVSPWVFNLFVFVFFLYKSKSISRKLLIPDMLFFFILMVIEVYCYYNSMFVLTSILYLIAQFGLLLYASLNVIYYLKNRESVADLDLKVSILYMIYILSLLSTIQLLGKMPERAKFAPSLLLIAASIYMVASWYKTINYKRTVSFIAKIIVSVITVVTVYAYWDWNVKMKTIENEIEYQKSLGNNDIFLSKDLYHPLIPIIGDWGNPGPDPIIWPNNVYAEHYGVNSITVK